MKSLKPIIYFSLFNHPLTEDEVFYYSEIVDKSEFNDEINTLLKGEVIDKIDDFLLFNNNKNDIKKRINGNKKAIDVMPKAKKTAAFISKFPFIEGVAISGSLSKGYFDNESDFDFFVITKSRRVWIARFFLALYKRLFLANSYKEFCINYFISTSTLEIEEKNKFTATEIITLLPLYGKQLFKDFYTKNSWVSDYYPHFKKDTITLKIKNLKKKNSIKFIEFLLNNAIGKSINYFLMRMITLKWENKYKDEKRSDQYKSKDEIAKHHPNSFQGKVIHKLNIEYQFCKQNYNIEIPKEHV